jgi:drug/metabolite transporter (DMT)-like permease
VNTSGRDPCGTSQHQRWLADGSLLAIAVVWGFSFVVMKNVLVSMSPMIMLLVRQLAGFAVVAPLPGGLRAACRRDWVNGGILGIVLTLAFIAEAVGLSRTTPGKAAFIVSLSVAMVPFMAAGVARRRPAGMQVTGALVATAGLAALSLQGNLTLSSGDALCLAAAALFAAQIVGVGLVARQTPPLVLTVTQLAVAAAFLSIVTPLVGPQRIPNTWQPWVAVLFLGVFTVGGPFFVQAWAQRHVPSSEAAILLSFAGLFASIFAVLLWNESLTWRLLVGAAGITAGLLLLELPTFRPGPEDMRVGSQEREVSPRDLRE